MNSLDEIQSLLSFEMTSSSTDLKLLARDNNESMSFSLDITVDSSGNLTAASIDGDTSLFTVSGSRIKGVEGTKYEGLSFVYLGDSSASIDVEISNGIAEGLYSAAYDASNETDGNIQTLIDSLTSQNTTMETKAETIRSRADSYGDVLSARYAKYQAAIQEAESTLSYLEAMLNSSSSDN